MIAGTAISAGKPLATALPWQPACESLAPTLERPSLPAAGLLCASSTTPSFSAHLYASPVASVPTSPFSFTAWTGCSLTEPRNLSSITGTSSFLGGLSLPSSCPEASERSLLYCSFSSDHRTAEASQAELMADLGCTVGTHARHTDSRRQCNRSPSGLRVQAVADAWAGFTHSLLAYGQVGAFAGSRTRAP
jgi:hypothetical protein